jgi:methionyl aminopeptidase
VVYADVFAGEAADLFSPRPVLKAADRLAWTGTGFGVAGMAAIWIGAAIGPGTPALALAFGFACFAFALALYGLAAARRARLVRVERGVPTALALWRTAWYCDRCDGVFFPDEVTSSGKVGIARVGEGLLSAPEFRRLVWSAGGYGDLLAPAVRLYPDIVVSEGVFVVELKTRAEIESIRAAGKVVAGILAATRAAAAPGVTLKELDEVARAVLRDAGATSPFLNYKPRFAPVPYPAVICTSVNDAALHGIPDGYELRPGDLLSVDAGATLDGWVGDAAISFLVGESAGEGPEADARLISVTEAALAAGIAAARPGGRLGDISAAIGKVGRAGGYGISIELGGHGVGRTMHEDPHIPNIGKHGRGLRLAPGLVLAIEPWFMAGGHDDIYVDKDGWTIKTGDGSRAAHAEHTIAITDDGPVILTAG